MYIGESRENLQRVWLLVQREQNQVIGSNLKIVFTPSLWHRSYDWLSSCAVYLLLKHLTQHTGSSRRWYWSGTSCGECPKNTEVINELGCSGGMPPGEFFFRSCKMLKIWPFFHFCQALGGGHGSPGPPPLGAAYDLTDGAWVVQW